MDGRRHGCQSMVRLRKNIDAHRLMTVSLCSGIPPGESFDYVIPVNTSGQWGTYWVHSHAKVSHRL